MPHPARLEEEETILILPSSKACCQACISQAGPTPSPLEEWGAVQEAGIAVPQLAGLSKASGLAA